MAKHRKTRKEKQLADLRHNFTHKFVSAAPYELKFDTPKQAKTLEVNKVSTRVISTSAYGYLVRDLSKTALVTAVILAFQIILFFLFKHHAIVITGINY